MTWNTLTNGQPNDADEVMENFDAVLNEIWGVVGANQDLYGIEPLDTSSGTITLPAGKVYRLSSMNVVTNNLELTGNDADNPTVFIVDGDVTISATIDGIGHGAGGGSVGVDVNGGKGGEHTIQLKPGEGGGGGGLTSGTGGSAGVMVGFTNTPSNMQTIFNVLPGTGGGGGADDSPGTPGAGGAGGACIIIICKDDFNGSGGTIDVSGADGGNGDSDSGSGGGGAGGMVVIAYGGSYTALGTTTVAGGSGGSGGGGTCGSGGGGDSIGGTATAGENSGSGGDGGDGSAGASYTFSIGSTYQED